MKRLKMLGLFALAVGAVVAFTPPAILATVSITRLGTYWQTSNAWDSATAKQVGGITYTYNASDSEKVGDVVYLTSNNTTAKSTTLVNYNTIVGIVCGGTRSSPPYSCAADTTEVGTLAAIAGQKVNVVCAGRAFTKTADSVYYGGAVIPSNAVAGTVKRRTTAIDSLNRIIGKSIVTRDSGKVIPLMVNVC